MASNDENDTSGERAAEDSNSSELLPGSLPVDFVEMVLILRLQTILQVENMAVIWSWNLGHATRKLWARTCLMCRVCNAKNNLVF